MVNVNDKSLQQTLQRHLERAANESADSTEKIASGTIFSRQDPRPAERAIAEGLEYKIRSLATSKRNINDAVSLLQTADGALSQVNDMVIRMKEINIAAANTTINSKERNFLFIEYEAIHDEIQRIAESTVFNGIPLLNGNDERSPESLTFRLDDPMYSENADNDDGDINAVTFGSFRNIVATPEGLGLRSARDLLENASDGITAEDAYELLTPNDSESFNSIYDEALNSVTTARAMFGAMQGRMQHAIDFNEVFSENISAAKSQIADVDYASELTKLASSRILQQAGTAVLAQTNFAGGLTSMLLNSLDR